MSQQTVMSVVLPKFDNFIATLPNVQALATCSETTLRSLWAGLGYYARARNLQRGAQYVLENYGDNFPVTYDEWLQVPGIGPYSASILSSVHAGERRACVDGNVVRVVSRLLGMHAVEDVWSIVGQRSIQKFVQQALDAAPRDLPAGDFNQALMELGATLCRKKIPDCLECPVKGECRAWDLKIQNQCPPPKPRKTREEVFGYVLNVQMLGEFGRESFHLLGTRTVGFLQKTVGLPLVDSKHFGDLQKEMNLLLCSESLKLQLPDVGFSQSRTVICHSITNHHLSLRLLTLTLSHGNALAQKTLENLLAQAGLQSLHWVKFAELERTLASNLDRKAMALFATPECGVKTLDCLLSNSCAEKLGLNC